MELLQGRKGLIVGVANSRSIACGISAAVAAQGAELILTYQNERLRPKVAEIAEELGAVDLLACDVGSDASGAALAVGSRATGGRGKGVDQLAAQLDRAWELAYGIR